MKASGQVIKPVGKPNDLMMKQIPRKPAIIRTILATSAAAISLLTLRSAVAQDAVGRPGDPPQGGPPPGVPIKNAPAVVAGNTDVTAERVIVTGSKYPDG